jgi:hypothetical protein
MEAEMAMIPVRLSRKFDPIEEAHLLQEAQPSCKTTTVIHVITQKMQKRLSETIDHLRAGIVKVKDPQLKAMFETAAEVLEGSVKAFKGYEKKNEPA